MFVPTKGFLLCPSSVSLARKKKEEINSNAVNDVVERVNYIYIFNIINKY